MVRDTHGLGWIGRIVAVAILAAVYFGAYAVFLAPQLPSPFAAAVAEAGDDVEVDYIGWFQDNGRVFDTSIESVARDNVSYPKAASFTYRPGGAYESFGFQVGCTGGSSCPVKGFQDAVVEMQIGETKRVVLTPDLAYGPPDPALIETRPLFQEVQATETLTAEEYRTRFGGEPIDGRILVDATWGWNVTLRVSGTIVTIRHSPTLGQLVIVAGKWSARVVVIDDGANEGLGIIRVQHFLAEGDVRAFLARDLRGSFVIVAVDWGNGTYAVDYNNEVVGRNLIFEITVRALRKGGP